MFTCAFATTFPTIFTVGVGRPAGRGGSIDSFFTRAFLLVRHELDSIELVVLDFIELVVFGLNGQRSVAFCFPLAGIAQLPDGRVELFAPRPVFTNTDAAA